MSLGEYPVSGRNMAGEPYQRGPRRRRNNHTGREGTRRES